MDHYGLFIDNTVNKKELLWQIRNARGPFLFLEGLKGQVFSNSEIEYFLEEEARHNKKPLVNSTTQAFKTFSSGEKKKALMKYVLRDHPDYLVLDNPFDHLDKETCLSLKKELSNISEKVLLIQLLSRQSDLLPMLNKFGDASDKEMQWSDDPGISKSALPTHLPQVAIPKAPAPIKVPDYPIFSLNDVGISYMDKPIIKEINWKVQPGDFWELSGPNGSGKTTILSMITGDNPKAYGQDITIMGIQKGSGESVWDLKRYIGYFSPAIMYRFRGYHSLTNMLISGLHDSIGLYVVPTESEISLAHKWLEVIGMKGKGQTYFHDLTEGQKRLIMCARAMIKHPLLLILDEPTASLDDNSASLVVSLVNKMAEESTTAIIFVSHRNEPGLKAPKIFNLHPSPTGSIGKII